MDCITHLCIIWLCDGVYQYLCIIWLCDGLYLISLYHMTMWWSKSHFCIIWLCNGVYQYLCIIWPCDELYHISLYHMTMWWSESHFCIIWLCDGVYHIFVSYDWLWRWGRGGGGGGGGGYTVQFCYNSPSDERTLSSSASCLFSLFLPLYRRRCVSLRGQLYALVKIWYE